jgi:hypothetical protein
MLSFSLITSLGKRSGFLLVQLMQSAIVAYVEEWVLFQLAQHIQHYDQHILIPWLRQHSVAHTSRRTSYSTHRGMVHGDWSWS